MKVDIYCHESRLKFLENKSIPIYNFDFKVVEFNHFKTVDFDGFKI